MFCPECKTEYRPGFIHCSDCNVDLVESILEPDHGSDLELHGVWEGQDQSECVSICKRLRAAEIPFKVIQNHQLYLKRLDENFKIGVPLKFSSKAKEIIEEPWSDFTDEVEDQRNVELSADDTPNTHGPENDNLNLGD
jgi:hypothetical protein